MDNRKLKFTNLKVGITVLAGIIIFFFFVIIVGSEMNYFRSTYKLKVFQENAVDMSTGAMVTLGGLKIGSVDDITFSSKDGVNGVDIVFTLPQTYKDRITSSSVAEFKTKGLLGDKYIDISIGQPGELSIENGSYLPVKPSVSLEKLSESLEPALNDFSEVVHNLSIITKKLTTEESGLGGLINNPQIAADIEAFVKNAKSLTSALANKEGSLGKLLYDDSLYTSLSNATAGLEQVTSGIAEGKGSLGKLITDDSLYNNLDELSARMNTLLAQTENDTTMIGGLLRDGKLYTDFNNLLRDLDSLLIDLKENPDRYVQFSIF